MTKQPIARRILLAVIATCLVSTIALPATVAQSQQDFWKQANRKFYLHLGQYCDREVSLIRWIDEFDWANDLDGCGGYVQEPESTWTDVFPLFVPLYANITSATAASMHIFILSRAVDQTSVEATFDTGYAKCTGSSGPQLITNEKVGGFHEFVMDCTFEVSGTPEPRSEANLTITVTATHTYGYGTESPHASYIELSGVDPAPPNQTTAFYAEGERPKVNFDENETGGRVVLEEISNRPKESSPGLGALGLIAGIAVAAVSMRRFRA